MPSCHRRRRREKWKRTRQVRWIRLLSLVLPCMKIYPACANFGSCTAEARRTQRSEFVSSSIPSSELCVLCGKIFHSSLQRIITKSLPTSLCQREGKYPSFVKRGPGEIC